MRLICTGKALAKLARGVALAWLADRDLRRAKALLRRSDRRFRAAGLFAASITASGVPAIAESRL